MRTSYIDIKVQRAGGSVSEANTLATDGNVFNGIKERGSCSSFFTFPLLSDYSGDENGIIGFLSFTECAAAERWRRLRKTCENIDDTPTRRWKLTDQKDEKKPPMLQPSPKMTKQYFCF
jgi:hypothetical protein